MVYNEDLKAKLEAKGVKPSLDRILTGKFEGSHTNREGISQWYDSDVFMNLFDASQKQAELLYKIFAPNLEGYRLNPLIGFDITFDQSDAPALKKLDDAVINFLAKNEDIVAKVVTTLTTSPNFKAKALKRLSDALKLLKLSQSLEQHEKNHVESVSDKAISEVVAQIS